VAAKSATCASQRNWWDGKTEESRQFAGGFVILGAIGFEVFGVKNGDAAIAAAHEGGTIIAYPHALYGEGDKMEQMSRKAPVAQEGDDMFALFFALHDADEGDLVDQGSAKLD